MASALSSPSLSKAQPEAVRSIVPAGLPDEAYLQLDEYLAGSRREFTVALHQPGTPFQLRVWEQLLRIPYGHTITYGELARRIGHPNATRAVAQACGANRLPIFIPCHRVVAAHGPGGYAFGVAIKHALLDLERHFSV